MAACSSPALETNGRTPLRRGTWRCAGLDEAELATTASDGWTLVTRAVLPGAGNWSHQYGNPANTAVSADTRVKGGLGVLWYGDPGIGDMVNRHEGAVGPLATNGRLFVQGETTIKAYDAYNGLYLWTYENPEALRTGVFQNQNPGNLAASDDRLFHFIKDRVLSNSMPRPARSCASISCHPARTTASTNGGTSRSGRPAVRHGDHAQGTGVFPAAAGASNR